jgi:hypothetical protein
MSGQQIRRIFIGICRRRRDLCMLGAMKHQKTIAEFVHTNRIVDKWSAAASPL